MNYVLTQHLLCSKYVKIPAARRLFWLWCRARMPPTCTLSTASPSVTICTPADGATGLTSPVHVNAGTTDNSSPVSLVQIYVDGIKKVDSHANFVDANVDMAAGSHRLTVQAKDNAGTIFKKSIMVTVGRAPPPPPGDLSL